jgi:DNA-binding phage protein
VAGIDGNRQAIAIHDAIQARMEDILDSGDAQLIAAARTTLADAMRAPKPQQRGGQ